MRVRWCAPLNLKEPRGVVNGELSGSNSATDRKSTGRAVASPTSRAGLGRTASDAEGEQDAGLNRSRKQKVEMRGSFFGEHLLISGGLLCSGQFLGSHYNFSNAALQEIKNNPAQFRRSDAREDSTWLL